MSSGWWRHLHRLALLTCLAVGTATLAGAADLAKTWEVGGDLVFTNYANGSELRGSLGFGGRGAYHFKSRDSVEFMIQKANTDSTVSDSNVSYSVTKWTIDYLHDLKVKKPESKIDPFIIFGVGKFNYDDGDTSSSKTVLQFGGGLRYFMTQKFALRFDGKMWHFHGGDSIPDGHWFAFDVAAGVSWFIGGHGK
jgi:hypothetical protein